MDALVEFAIELGGDALELLLGLFLGSREKRKANRKQRKTGVSGAEPWEQEAEMPPWEM